MSSLSMIFIGLPVYLASLFVNHSPWMIPYQPPTYEWVDGPVKLVSTPQYLTNKTDVFTSGATHMALVHNAMIRGFNSIYLQAPHVRSDDKADFRGYSLTWLKFVKSHSDDEEDNLFGLVESVLKDDTIWKGAKEEHESFLPGLEAFESYLTGLSKDTSLSSVTLLKIMDSFRESFEHHMHSEVATIANLANHPAAPVEGSLHAADVAHLLKSWGKKTVTKAGIVDVVPFFMLNLDRTAEDGLWANWPAMPKPVKWGLVNLAGTWHGRWWKFASCDSQGNPAELYSLQTAELDRADAEKLAIKNEQEAKKGHFKAEL